jgi:hypothetical protein
MLIKIGYDIALRFPISTPVIYLLRVHPSRRSDLVEPERFSSEPALPVHEYYDGFGNHRGRLYALAGTIRLSGEAIVRDSGAPDVYAPNARQLDISEIPAVALESLLPSRYCEVDSELMDFAWRTFLQARPGWERVQAVCDFCPWASSVRLSASSERSYCTRTRRFQGTGRRVSRLHASGDYALPLPEHSS